ncbi:MAG: AEC family transporter [Hyphomicrobiales bacterium]|nr:AEC family transporter [Hyphomicrobiales bacterium]
MLASINAVAPLALIIMLGYALNRYRVAGPDIWSAIEHICFYILFPFMIVRMLARANLSDLPVQDYAIVTFGGVFGMMVLLLIARPLMARLDVSGPSFTSLFQGATRWHGFMALAIVGTLYGEPGIALVALAISLLVPFLNIAAIAVLSIWGRSEENTLISAQSTLLRIAKNPLVWACIIGILLNLSGIPDFLFSAIEIIGDGGLGLAMLSVGAGLQIGTVWRTKWLLMLGVLIRLVGMPLMMILFAWIIGLEGLSRTVAIIAGAVPTASTSYVMARKMGGDCDLMANIVTFQVLVSGITLPIFIYIAQNL